MPAVSGNVLANDTDVDVEPLIVANPGTYVGANGTLVLAANGSYTYTPNAGAQALDDGEVVSDSFSYTASDGTASDTATLIVTVNGANDAPVANDDTASTNEDAAGVSGNVLTNDTDVDVEPLTVANPGTYVGTYGTLTLAADGSYTYTPGAAAQGLDTGEVATGRLHLHRHRRHRLRYGDASPSPSPASTTPRSPMTTPPPPTRIPASPATCSPTTPTSTSRL